MSFKEVLKEVYQKLNFLGNIAIALCIVTIIIQFINKDTFKNTQQKRNLQSNDLILLFEKLNRSRIIPELLDSTLLQTTTKDTCRFSELGDGCYLLFGKNVCSTCVNGVVDFLKRLVSYSPDYHFSICGDFDNFKSLIVWNREKVVDGRRMISYARNPIIQSLDRPVLLQKRADRYILIPVFELQTSEYSDELLCKIIFSLN
jgi:hypothetical protein